MAGHQSCRSGRFWGLPSHSPVRGARKCRVEVQRCFVRSKGDFSDSRVRSQVVPCSWCGNRLGPRGGRRKRRPTVGQPRWCSREQWQGSQRRLHGQAQARRHPHHRPRCRGAGLQPGLGAIRHRRVHLRPFGLRPADDHQHQGPGGPVPRSVDDVERRRHRVDDHHATEHQVPRRHPM